MKKTLRVTLVDGKVIERDLDLGINQALKANQITIAHVSDAKNPFFVSVMSDIAANGLFEMETATAKYARYIPPSQFANLEIVFEEKPMIVMP